MATPDKVAGPASYFPSIDKAYGEPIEQWMQVLSSAGCTSTWNSSAP